VARYLKIQAAIADIFGQGTDFKNPAAGVPDSDLGRKQAIKAFLPPPLLIKFV
jgi:hypothetical protein